MNHLKILLKSILHSLPYRVFVFKVIRKFKLPESLYKHLYFIGIFEVSVDSKHAFIVKHHGFQVENDIFWSGLFGKWEKDSLFLWYKLSKHADVVFDIGANTGIYSLLAKATNENCRVYSFDPVVRVYEKLIENIWLNNYDVNAFQIALSNNTGTAIIYDTDSPHTYSVTVNKNLHLNNSAVKECTIETMRLDDFIELNDIKKIDLMKLDVETHEPEVLEGMGIYLKLFKPTLLIEILNDEIAYKIESYIKGANYIYFNLNEQGSIKKVDNLSQSDFHNFLICSPEIARKLNLVF